MAGWYKPCHSTGVVLQFSPGDGLSRQLTASTILASLSEIASFFDKILLMVSFAFSLYVMGDFLRVENKAETAQIRWVDKSVVVYVLSISIHPSSGL